MLRIGNFLNSSGKRVKGDNLRCSSILRNGTVIAADNYGLGAANAVGNSLVSLIGLGDNSVIKSCNTIVELSDTAIGLIHCLCGRFDVNIFSGKSICGVLCGICKQGLRGSVLKHTLSCSLRGFGSIVTICGRRGNVSKTEVIHTVYSTAKLVKILLKKISVFSKKSCDIVIYTLTGGIAYIAFIVDIIVCVIYVSDRFTGGGLTYSFSFFRRSYGLLRLLLSSLLFLGLLCRLCRSGSRSSLGSRSGLGHRLGHRYRRGSGCLILGDLTVCDVIHLVGEDHALTFFFGLLFRLLIIVCKAHSVVVLILITVKVVGIKVENHAFRLICRFLYGSFLCYGLFNRRFLYGSFFCYGLFNRSFLYGSFLCCGLFCRRFLYGSFLCCGLFSRSFLYGSFLCYGLFNRSFLYGSFFCYRLFNRSFHSRLFSLFLRLLFSKALLYLFEKFGSVLSSASGFFLFLSDLFLDGLASGSLSFFLFLGKESLLFSLLASLSRSHRTLFGILLELLSVIVSIFKGCKSFLMQAL